MIKPEGETFPVLVSADFSFPAALPLSPNSIPFFHVIYSLRNHGRKRQVLGRCGREAGGREPTGTNTKRFRQSGFTVASRVVKNTHTTLKDNPVPDTIFENSTAGSLSPSSMGLRNNCSRFFHASVSPFVAQVSIFISFSCER